MKNVNMMVRLVVLSCCYCGWGKIKVEGVVGIVWVFLGVGVCFVEVLLWVIDDVVIF